MKITLGASWLLLLLILLVVTEEASAATLTWSFKNWNKYKSNPSNETAAWRKVWKITKWGWPRKNSVKNDNNVIIKDPASSSEYVLDVIYPQGSNSPGGSKQGGIGFYAVPIELQKRAKTMTLEYKVYFPKNFQFVLGGKLPGLYGGRPECSGGVDATDCFSTRFMWRKDGDGEVYAYMPEGKQRDNLCDQKYVKCNSAYGYSLGRGTWRFTTGRWTTVKQTLTLNTPGKADGKVVVHVDGKLVYTGNQIAYRGTKTGQTVGIAFHTFFGGSGSEWSTPRTQHTYFKGFVFKVTV